MSDREIAKASEEVTRRNVLAIQSHSNDTRKMLRQLEEVVTALIRRTAALEKLFEEQRRQQAILQQKIYQGGTSGD